MSQERREYHRTSLPSDCRLLLRISEEVKGRVLDLSERGLRVALEGVCGAHGGQRLPQAWLIQGDQQTAVSLRCVDHSDNETGCLMSVAAETQETSASLWQALQEVRRPPREERPKRSASVIPERKQQTEAARVKRLRWLQERTGVNTAPLAPSHLQAERLSCNIENLIGSVEIPVGIAGPLLIQGEQARGEFCLPMATTEGALVSSVTRGALALSLSGGARTRVVSQSMSRTPVFVFRDIDAAMLFSAYVVDHVELLKSEIKKVSHRAELISVEPVLLDRTVHVRFTYRTGDAAGQNMTTSCTWQAAQWLVKQLSLFPSMQLERFAIDGNMGGDKKVTWGSCIQGRGTRVVTEAFIPRKTLMRVLKVTPENMVQSYSVGCAAAAESGMVGFNVNVANVVAAAFTATGQDIACVNESSTAILRFEAERDGLYVGLTLPNLVIGTVGGGTHLPAQAALLETLGCSGTGKVQRLAEVIGAFALALDLSTSAAIVAGHFVQAHERLGRNRPEQGFTRKELLAPSLYEDGLRASTGDPTLKVHAVALIEGASEGGILSDFAAPSQERVEGLHAVRVQHAGISSRGSRDFVVKVKPKAEALREATSALARIHGEKVEWLWREGWSRTEFSQSHLRELGMYRQQDAKFREHMPEVIRIVEDRQRHAYAIAMERLKEMPLLDSRWSAQMISSALRDVSRIHSVFLGRPEVLSRASWFGTSRTSADMVALRPLLEALVSLGADQHPDWITSQRRGQLRGWLDTLPLWWRELEMQPQSIIHNDFNPRNLAMRPTSTGPKLCLFDWELAASAPPQRDLAEFLCFVLSPEASREQVNHWVEHHRTCLDRESGIHLCPETWRRGYRLALQDLAIYRFALYLMVQTTKPQKFMGRVYSTLWRLLELEGA